MDNKAATAVSECNSMEKLKKTGEHLLLSYSTQERRELGIYQFPSSTG